MTGHVWTGSKGCNSLPLFVNDSTVYPGLGPTVAAVYLQCVSRKPMKYFEQFYQVPVVKGKISTEAPR